MWDEINKEQFEEIMDGLYGKDVWIKVIVPISWINLYYPEFDFYTLTNGKYHFVLDMYDDSEIIIEHNV